MSIAIQKAYKDANEYTQAELTESLRLGEISFYFAGLAGWLIMSFFIGQFFAGSELELLEQWTTFQTVMFILGVLLATGIIGTQIVLFRSGKTREFWTVTFITVAFCIWAETAATMQREQLSVKTKSTESEVFKSTIGAINTLSTSTALTETQQSLASYQAYVNELKADPNPNHALIQTASREVARLTEVIRLERENKNALLSSTINQAKDMQYDETHHQAMIRLIAEFAGISFVFASAIFAGAIVITFEIAFGYLGHHIHRTKRALSIQNGTFDNQRYEYRPTLALMPAGAVQEPQNNRHVHGEKEAEGGQESAPNPWTRIEWYDGLLDDMKVAYSAAKAAKVGDNITCPNCATDYEKKIHNQCFCKPTCRDEYHNTMNPSRKVRA